MVPYSDSCMSAAQTVPHIAKPRSHSIGKPHTGSPKNTIRMTSRDLLGVKSTFENVKFHTFLEITQFEVHFSKISFSSCLEMSRNLKNSWSRRGLGVGDPPHPQNFFFSQFFHFVQKRPETQNRRGRRVLNPQKMIFSTFCLYRQKRPKIESGHGLRFGVPQKFFFRLPAK